MNSKEQIMIDGVNIIGTIDEWARLVAHEWGTNEYSDAEIVKNYILDINKQLARKTKECEQIKEKYEALKLENQEGYEIVAELKHECEELEKQLETSEKWRIKAESLNENFELKNTCYRKALEEIEKYLQTQLDGFGNDVYEMQKSAINNIRNIISRAKEG